MKRILLIIAFMFPTIVFAASYNTDVNVSNYYECFALQEENKSATGTGYFAYCIRTKCENGVWQSYYLFNKNTLACANGNTDIYTYEVRYSCGEYKGACSQAGEEHYCGKLIGYDCNKTNNGSIYVPSSTTKFNPPTVQTSTLKPYTTTTTKKRTTTRKSTTTKKPTTTTTTTTQAPKDNNSFLKTLDVVNHHIEFNKEILSYEIIIEKDEKSLDVKYEAESYKAIATIQNNENIDITKPIIVKVTAEDGTFKEYTINAKYREISSNKNVKNITVDSYDLGFDSTKFEYDLVIKSSETELTINVELEDEKTKYEINGNSNLENGSVITIDVKAEDESSITYKINIIKEVDIVPKKSGVGKVITTIIILILLGVIGVVAFKFIRNILPAKADENYDYE